MTAILGTTSIRKPPQRSREAETASRNAVGERKGRPRTTVKSHKKRVKDLLLAVQPNGFASPVKSPTNLNDPIEEFSLKFMNLYRQPEPSSTDSN